MQQVFFLIISAMFVAFSLSWASSGGGSERFSAYLVPEEIQFPLLATESENVLFAKIKLRGSCESVDSIVQERRGSKIIFSIRMRNDSDQVCLLQPIKDVSIKLKIQTQHIPESLYFGIYFRQDEENLKYFGAVSGRKESLN